MSSSAAKQAPPSQQYMFQRFSLKNNLLIEKPSKAFTKHTVSSTHRNANNSIPAIPKDKLPEEIVEEVKSKLNFNKVSFSQLVIQKLETLQTSPTRSPTLSNSPTLEGGIEKQKKTIKKYHSQHPLPASRNSEATTTIKNHRVTLPQEKLRLSYILN